MRRGAIESTVTLGGETHSEWRAADGRAAFINPANNPQFNVRTTMGGRPLPAGINTIGAGGMRLPALFSTSAVYECQPRRRLTFFDASGMRAVYVAR